MGLVNGLECIGRVFTHMLCEIGGLNVPHQGQEGTAQFGEIPQVMRTKGFISTWSQLDGV